MPSKVTSKCLIFMYSFFPTVCQPHDSAVHRPASKQNCRQGSSRLLSSCGGSPCSAGQWRISASPYSWCRSARPDAWSKSCPYPVRGRYGHAVLFAQSVAGPAYFMIASLVRMVMLVVGKADHIENHLIFNSHLSIWVVSTNSHLSPNTFCLRIHRSAS